ncbi:helix-turn-helix domain-containing protein [Microvirga terricola]|uniref:Helix-turn-helix transcriptional regulator n=1 Tax=Microvirga terricola TaxID=2719797 RepID=A0ABX0V899_9HYPH|nr:helix-turn-helix transcriptional regulator [Microvirga terricola]NIX75201.1 helix-turn-helix transcriptional regulator [Microvirga terricola]
MTDFLKRTIGSRVRTARKATGQTQEQLASAVGCTIESVSNIERGVSLPTLRTLSRIAANLGVSLKDLFPDESEDHSEAIERRIQLNALVQQLSEEDTEAVIAMVTALVRKRTSENS